MSGFSRALPFAALFLGACGGITPLDGSWATDTAYTVDNNECDLDLEPSEEEDVLEIELSNGDDGSLTFTFDDDSTVDCLFEDGLFDCEPMIEVSDIMEDGSAMLTISQTLTGSFDSDSTGSLSFSIDMDCEGDNCELLGMDPLPCNSAITASFSHAGS
jgi:hypothetical protein